MDFDAGIVNSSQNMDMENWLWCWYNKQFTHTKTAKYSLESPSLSLPPPSLYLSFSLPPLPPPSPSFPPFFSSLYHSYSSLSFSLSFFLLPSFCLPSSLLIYLRLLLFSSLPLLIPSSLFFPPSISPLVFCYMHYLSILRSMTLLINIYISLPLHFPSLFIPLPLSSSTPLLFPSLSMLFCYTYYNNVFNCYYNCMLLQQLSLRLKQSPHGLGGVRQGRPLTPRLTPMHFPLFQISPLFS